MIAHQEEISQQLAKVQQRIKEVALNVGRNPEEITLVAVTKTWPVEIIMAAYQAGVRHIGENRPEELSQKRQEFDERFPQGKDLAWHQIGTLQSRKSQLTVYYADFFHALDRMKIARRLSNQLEETRRILPVFVEVNLSGESSKSGFQLNKWEEDATQRDTLRNVIETISQLPGLEPRGLMTMAPWGVNEELIRSVFRRTRLLSEWLQEELPLIPLGELSMGMTDDYWIAVEEGATMVRIGRAIFGSRE